MTDLRGCLRCGHLLLLGWSVTAPPAREPVQPDICPLAAGSGGGHRRDDSAQFQCCRHMV